MALLQFTTYSDIRAALGVSAEELEDTTLSLSLYEQELAADLEGVSSTLVDDFLALPADPDDFSKAQKKFDDAIRLFATYSVANHLTASLPLFSPKEITDGKAGFSRYAADPYQKTITAVAAKYEQNRLRLVDAYAALQSTTSTPVVRRTFFSAVAAAYDPVTDT